MVIQIVSTQKLFLKVEKFKYFKEKIYILISNYNLLKKQFNILKYNIKMIEVKNIKENNFSDKLKILNIDLKFKNPFKVSLKESSNFC